MCFVRILGFCIIFGSVGGFIEASPKELSDYLMVIGFVVVGLLMLVPDLFSIVVYLLTPAKEKAIIKKSWYTNL